MSENGFRKGEWQDGQWEPSDDDAADGMPVRLQGPGLPEADFQLLELAARAIGARVEVVKGENWVNLHFEDGSIVYGWNSLMFSGDTLDVAADLELDIMQGVDGVLIGHPSIPTLYQPVGEDRRSATRRAVTHAAAEIGKLSNV